MPTNQLEAGIISGSREAAKNYLEMTGGWLLSHGPEHFLQNEIARAIWKQGFYVFLDVSEKTVRAQLEGVREPGGSLQRFDVSVFYKHSERIRAFIEIKTKATYSSTALALDAKKIGRHFAKDVPHASTGYLLAYAEVYRENRARDLKVRFRATFVRALGPNRHLVKSFVRADDARWEAKGWDTAWGIALYRFSGLRTRPRDAQDRDP